MINEDELSYLKNYYRTLENLYESGAITKEQFEKEARRLDYYASGGVLWQHVHGGNVEFREEPFYVGMAAYMGIRLLQVFGPAILASPLGQKLLDKITGDTATTPQITVLGKWYDIQKLNGSYNMLNINPKVFRFLELIGQGWNVNRAWLDKCIARGDTFYLASNPWDWLGKSSYFSKELEYMLSQGYRIVGNFLVIWLNFKIGLYDGENS